MIFVTWASGNFFTKNNNSKVIRFSVIFTFDFALERLFNCCWQSKDFRLKYIKSTLWTDWFKRSDCASQSRIVPEASIYELALVKKRNVGIYWKLAFNLDLILKSYLGYWYFEWRTFSKSNHIFVERCVYLDKNNCFIIHANSKLNC